jgi:NAD(P) transhydrogenase subunit alpha
MKIGTPKESLKGEKRVAMTPQSAIALKKLGYECLVETGAGSAARFSDQAYRDAGVTVVPSAADLWAQADVVAKVRPPASDEVDAARSGQILLSLLYPGQDRELLESLRARGVTALAMDMVPRISRAQKMDVGDNARLFRLQLFLEQDK